jgi:hypothetical protein
MPETNEYGRCFVVTSPQGRQRARGPMEFKMPEAVGLFAANKTIIKAV